MSGSGPTRDRADAHREAREDPADVGAALAAYARDLRVVAIAFVLVTPAIVLLPGLFPDRGSDPGQRLVDALAFGAIVLAGLWLGRRLVGAWDRRSGGARSSGSASGSGSAGRRR